jgi:adenylate kinase family enzyme
MTPQTFVFYGIAGAGKGTQIKLLTDFLKNKNGLEIIYASPGNEYRKITQIDNYIGSLVKGPLSRGELLPGFLTDSIMANIFISSLTPEKNLIADGYPRAVDQSVSFEKMIKFFERKDVKIIYIEISKNEAIKRLKLRGRHDDTDEGITKRFDEYVKSVVPSMNYFKDMENYTTLTINGEQNIEEVHKDIIKALKF